MPAAIDITGQRYGRLTVIRSSGHVQAGKELKRAWECLCDCGATLRVATSALRTGNTSSCGCLHNEQLAIRSTRHGASRGRDGTRTYSSWEAMKSRCNNPKNIGWDNYGGRGIRVCDQWNKSFEAFLDDMGKCPPGHSIDRINPNGNYEPGNCRWLLGALQNRNTRAVIRVAFNGKMIPLTEACEYSGVKISSVRGMANRESAPHQAVFDRLLARRVAA